MSKKGMMIAAKVFSVMQEARGELLALGGKKPSTKTGHQDILLGQMFDHAKDAIKEEFCKLTVMDVEPASEQGYKSFVHTSLDCRESLKGCPYIKICAQHVSAGDHRGEGGMTPDIVEYKEEFFCKKIDTETHNGFLVVNENENLVPFYETYFEQRTNEE